jgi:ABC-type phosphate transport system substrate-binding protein
MQRLHWLILFPLALISADSQAVEVIANPSVKIESLSPSKARNIFSMRTRNWANDTPIRVYVLDDSHDLHKQFSKEILSVFPYKLRRVWDRNTFSGTGQAPTTVKNEEEMIKIISSTKGAIGYANKGNVNVHVIKVH